MNREKEPVVAAAEQEGDAESLESIETEPVLTYSRMKNDVSEILKNDSVSCIRTDHKILVLGTHWGRIHIMDHDGNKIITKDCVSERCVSFTDPATGGQDRADFSCPCIRVCGT
jgi:hypothetical protein